MILQALSSLLPPFQFTNSTANRGVEAECGPGHTSPNLARTRSSELVLGRVSLNATHTVLATNFQMVTIFEKGPD